MPVPAGIDGRLDPRWVLRRPHHQVRGTDRDLLLATRAAISLPGALPRHASDQEVALAGALGLPSTERHAHIRIVISRAGPAATVGAVTAQRTMGPAGHQTTVSRPAPRDVLEAPAARGEGVVGVAASGRLTRQRGATTGPAVSGPRTDLGPSKARQWWAPVAGGDDRAVGNGVSPADRSPAVVTWPLLGAPPARDRKRSPSQPPQRVATIPDRTVIAPNTMLT